jgi:ATP-dependent RNA helicase DeaD
MQTVDVLHDLASFKRGIRIMALYGGEPIARQINALKKRPQIIVATPGRMIDHLNRRTVRLGAIRTVVLDEADRMLDMGFRNDMKLILNESPSERQTVLFSATMSAEVLGIAKSYQKNAERISVEHEQKTVDTVTQFYAEVEVSKRDATLVELLRDSRFKRGLVFVSRKHLAREIAATLVANSINAAALQGNMSQSQRNRVMAEYKHGEIDVLVATDVAARGIDVDNIDVVINYDLPQDSDSYIHRIGRTGRANKEGIAYTFIAPKDNYTFRQIMRKTNTNVESVKLGAAENVISRKAAAKVHAKPFKDRSRQSEGRERREHGGFPYSGSSKKTNRKRKYAR